MMNGTKESTYQSQKSDKEEGSGIGITELTSCLLSAGSKTIREKVPVRFWGRMVTFLRGKLLMIRWMVCVWRNSKTGSSTKGSFEMEKEMELAFSSFRKEIFTLENLKMKNRMD
jgi:hypothetical protein